MRMRLFFLTLPALLWAVSTPSLAVDHLMIVTTTADDLDAFDQKCSLREAIHNLGQDTPYSPVVNECPPRDALANNVIVLQNGATYSLTRLGPAGPENGDLNAMLTPGLIATLRPANPDGAYATLRQQNSSWRILELHGGELNMENLRLTGATVANFGAVKVNYQTVLRMRHVLMEANAAMKAGCLYNVDGTVEIFDSRFTQCQATGTDAHGGAIWSSGTLRIENTRFDLNTAHHGGGLYLAGGTALLSGTGPLWNFELNQATGVSLSRGGAIYITGSASVSMNGMRLKTNSAVQGGAIYHEDSAELLLDGGNVRSNSAAYTGGGVMVDGNALLRVRNAGFSHNVSDYGGAIYAQNTNIDTSLFEENDATQSGGAVMSARMQISNSEFVDNESAKGGALMGLKMDVSRSMFYENRTTAAPGASGGAVYLDAMNAPHVSRFSQVLFGGNIAADKGGALYVHDGIVNLANVTISGNNAASGGGLYVADAADVTAVNTTFAENYMGRDIAKYGTLRLANTIIDTPAQPNCIVGLENPLILSMGHNLSDDDSCHGLEQGAGALTDILNVSAQLGLLFTSGGFSPTHPLLPGSPAIDAGDDAACHAEPVNGVDQRGAARPMVGCDIGAHEQGADPDAIFADGFEND